MPGKHNAGACQCCVNPCILFNENFTADTIASYTQNVGSWSISSGKLQTASANANITRDVTLPAAYIITAEMSGDGNSDESGVLFGYQDSSNYYKLVLTFASAADYCGNLKLIAVKAGVESTLLDYDLAWLKIDEFAKVEVCVTNASYPASGKDIRVKFSSYVYSTTRSIHYFKANDPTPLTGTSVGFMTGANSGTALFDRIKVETHYSVDAACRQCPTSCTLSSYEFSNNSHACEWDGGTVSGGVMSLTNTATATLRIPHPDGTACMIVEAVVNPDANVDRIYLYAANDTIGAGGAGPFGYVDFDASEVTIDNGAGDTTTMPVTLDPGPYTIRLCVCDNSAHFNIDDGNAVHGTQGAGVGNITLSGPYVKIATTGTGTTDVSSFIHYRYEHELTGAACRACAICADCDDGDAPEEWLVTVSGLDAALVALGWGTCLNAMDGSYYVPMIDRWNGWCRAWFQMCCERQVGSVCGSESTFGEVWYLTLQVLVSGTTLVVGMALSDPYQMTERCDVGWTVSPMNCGSIDETGVTVSNNPLGECFALPGVTISIQAA